MRIIQTVAYFDPEQVTGASPEVEQNPGISFTWFKNPETAEADPDFFQLFRDYSVPFGEARSHATDLFLDSALRGVRFSVVARQQLVLNSNVIGVAKETEIVVERSPVVGVGVGSILRGASNIAMGSYLGMQAAGGSTSLMFVTVPSGILVVCSAAGIGKALEKGLNRQISAIFEGKTPPLLRRGSKRKRPK
jgi:hypothetical protein